MAETLTEQVAKVGAHPADAEVRVTRRIEIGTAVHQGDLYLHAVAADFTHGKELGTRQVAVGNTVGSRHIAEGVGVTVYAGTTLPPGVKAPEWCRKGDLLGPVVVATEPWTLTHPEHAHHQLPAGTYAVTNQADYATRQRVMD